MRVEEVVVEAEEAEEKTALVKGGEGGGGVPAGRRVRAVGRLVPWRLVWAGRGGRVEGRWRGSARVGLLVGATVGR